jgi:hypothetical protein
MQTMLTYSAKIGCIELNGHVHKPTAASGLLGPPGFVKDLLEDLERVVCGGGGSSSGSSRRGDRRRGKRSCLYSSSLSLSARTSTI